MNAPAIVLGDPRGVLALPPAGMKNRIDWTQGDSDVLAHFIQVNQQIRGSRWHAAKNSFTIQGDKLLEAEFPDLEMFVFAAVLLVTASVVGGVWFVITIIDPAKYQIVAKQLAREIEASDPAASKVSRGSFMELFIDIEQLVRRIWLDKTDGQRLGQRQGMPSFREMLEVLYSNGVIGQDLYAQLMSVSKHRNVVVHGQVDFVNPDVFREAESARSRLNEIAGPGRQASEPVAELDRGRHSGVMIG